MVSGPGSMLIADPNNETTRELVVPPRGVGYKPSHVYHRQFNHDRTATRPATGSQHGRIHASWKPDAPTSRSPARHRRQDAHMGKRRAPVERNSFSQQRDPPESKCAGVRSSRAGAWHSPRISPPSVLAEAQLAAVANLVFVVADRKSSRKPTRVAAVDDPFRAGSFDVFAYQDLGAQLLRHPTHPLVGPEVSTCTFPQDHIRCRSSRTYRIRDGG